MRKDRFINICLGIFKKCCIFVLLYNPNGRDNLPILTGIFMPCTSYGGIRTPVGSVNAPQYR